MVSTQLPELVLDRHYAGLSADANGIPSLHAFGTTLKIIVAEIDRTIERSNRWTRHREAMQTMGTASRAHDDGRRLGDILTAQRMELVSMSCGGPNNLKSRPMVRVMTLMTRGAWLKKVTYALLL